MNSRARKRLCLKLPGHLWLIIGFAGLCVAGSSRLIFKKARCMGEISLAWRSSSYDIIHCRMTTVICPPRARSLVCATGHKAVVVFTAHSRPPVYGSSPFNTTTGPHLPPELKFKAGVTVVSPQLAWPGGCTTASVRSWRPSALCLGVCGCCA
jgi:hypothetical protein